MPRAKAATKAILENGSNGNAIESEEHTNNLLVDQIEVKPTRGTKRSATQVTKGRGKKVDSNGLTTDVAQNQQSDMKKTSKGRPKKDKTEEVGEEAIKKPKVDGKPKKIAPPENKLDVDKNVMTGRSTTIKTKTTVERVNTSEVPKGRGKSRAKPPVISSLVESDTEAKTGSRKHEKETLGKAASRGRKRIENPDIVDVKDEPAPRKRIKKQSDESTEIETTTKSKGRPQKVAEAEPILTEITTTGKRSSKKTKNEIPAETEEGIIMTAAPVKKKGRTAKESSQSVEKPSKKRGAVKPKRDETDMVEVKEETVTKSRGGRKRAAPKYLEELEAAENSVDEGKPTKAKKPALINATDSIYNKADFELQKAASHLDTNGSERYNLKISSWNVAGLRSWLKKDGLKFLEYEEPDIFCMQETKCSNDQLPPEVVRISGYHPYWHCMPGGYAGVAIYSKIMPITVEYGIGNEEFDDVGRMITAEYEKFYLINTYVPNSGRKLVNLEARMRWEGLFQNYVKKLDALKPVLICGDMNVSHLEIDLANPKANTKNAGFTKEERDKMTELLASGFVDTFRYLYPNRTGAYTFWTYMANARARNVGWRLDYFIVSERWTNRIVDNCIRSQCKGSDHCPITLFMKA